MMNLLMGMMRLFCLVSGMNWLGGMKWLFSVC